MPEPEVTPAAPAAPATPPATPAAGTDPVELARQLGEKDAELKKVKEEYEGYQGQVGPILETLWSDKELLEKAQSTHNKRLGKAPATPPTPPDGDHKPQGDPDTRNALIVDAHTKFEDKYGVSKLSDDKKKEIRGAVGQMLKSMLDPRDNKSMDQIYAEVSLVKLPWYLEKAYQLVNRDEDLRGAEERGKNTVLSQYGESTGMIGSMPGGSPPSEDVVLTPTEKNAAQKMGISEDDYLANKKKIIASRS